MSFDSAVGVKCQAHRVSKETTPIRGGGGGNRYKNPMKSQTFAGQIMNVYLPLLHGFFLVSHCLSYYKILKFTLTLQLDIVCYSVVIFINSVIDDHLAFGHNIGFVIICQVPSQ